MIYAAMDSTRMSYITAVLVSLVLTAASTDYLIEPGSKDNSPRCDCYLTSGPDINYFLYHRFWDFRNIQDDLNHDFTTEPPLITSQQDGGNEAISSAYFNSTQWIQDWSIETGATPNSRSPVPPINSAQNLYISRNTTPGSRSSTYISLRTNRLPNFQSTAEINSNQKNLLHSSIRARIRVMPNQSDIATPGAVFGLFTYSSDTQESDIEILTSDPTTTIRYTNQPDTDPVTGDAVPGASTTFTFPSDTRWTDWHDHRIDWLPGVSRWYVDGQFVLEKTLDVPTKPSGLVLNLWSDGGAWSGNMSVGGVVVVGIEWVQMLFNVSGGLGTRGLEGQCKVGCWVDSEMGAEVGVPVVAFNHSVSLESSAGRLEMGAWGVYGMWVVVVMVAEVVFIEMTIE